MHARRPGWDPRLVDGLLVALVAAVGLLGLGVLVVLGEGSPVLVPAAALALAQALPLWWRRRQPLIVLAVTLGALVTAQAAGDVNAASFLGPYAAAYAVAAYSDRTRAWIGLAMLVGAAALDVAAVRWVAGDLDYGAVLLSPAGVAALAAWGIGRYVQVRRAYLDAVIAYTHQLEHERDERAQQAVREERRRIARDLHDHVAHQLGIVSLHTGAARRWLGRDQGRTEEALAAAEQASRSALETMPLILQALRADDDTTMRSPQSGLSQLDTLVEQVQVAGITVERHTEGEPRPLPPAVELTAYRVVQEALTNVMKHARPATVSITLTYAPDRVRVAVDDDGDGLAANGTGGAGLGLTGMRERVELLEGELEVGPRVGGGFHVGATLPTTTSWVQVP
jgi:signal transduction histidine kinase